MSEWYTAVIEYLVKHSGLSETTIVWIILVLVGLFLVYKLLVFLGLIAQHLKLKEENEFNSVLENFHAGNPKVLIKSTGEIINEIAAYPLAEQQYARKKYKGLYVKWVVRINSVKKEGNKLRVLAYVENQNFPLIGFSVLEKDYKRLTLIKENEHFELTGQILDIDTICHELKVVQLIAKV